MTNWKCEHCGYMVKTDAAPPEKCPSCGEKCKFIDDTCYTPDCQYEGVDKRI